jgi:predicted aldo/keto reductase-like oxidoreductase
VTANPLIGGPRIGLGAAYGIGARGVHQAFDAGVRFFLWGALPKADFARGLRELSRGHRAELQLAVQTYARHGFTVRPGVELLLLRLGVEYLDWLCLGHWQTPPSEAVIEAAQRLVGRGLVRNLMISCHHRPNFAVLAQQRPSPYAAWMVRYNAAHRRAESEVFPMARGIDRPAIIAYTALRWGTLLDPRYAPPGEPPLSAVEAYRFVLSNPRVDLCLVGPRNEAELSAALSAMAQGPLDEAGLERARRIGDAAQAFGRAQPPPRMLDVLKETPSLLRSIWREGVTENLLSRFNR